MLRELTAGSKVGISEEPVEAPFSSLSKYLPRPVVNSVMGNSSFPSPVYLLGPACSWLPPLQGGREQLAGFRRSDEKAGYLKRLSFTAVPTAGLSFYKKMRSKET